MLEGVKQFTGKDLDEDTGLYYFGARWYDQEVGRFISEDPKFDPNNFNLYWYCDNIPLTNIDLDGRETTRADQKIFDAWFSSWTTKYNNAVKAEKAQRYAIWKQDPVAYAENRNLYNMGKRDAFGAEYQETVNLLDTTTAMMSAAPKVQDWIENQIANGHTPTTEEINNKAAEIAKANEDYETYMAPIIYGAIAWAQMGATGTQSISNSVNLIEEEAVKTINPNEIRYSQSSVNGAQKIIDSLKANGWMGDPIDVVRMSDGNLTTIDNTRVLAAKNAGIDVKAVVHGANDPIPPDMAVRFTSKTGEIPKTWGEAVNNRINNQNSTYRTTNPNGAYIIGWDGN
jgi:RHS repeat-associated protein